MCDFCDKEIIEKQGIYFNENAGIIYPRKPIIFGHVLIVPKNHVEFFHQLSDTDITEMRNVLSAIYKGFQEKYNATGYSLFTNNGK